MTRPRRAFAASCLVMLGASAASATPPPDGAVPVKIERRPDTGTSAPEEPENPTLVTRVGAFSTTAFGLSGGGFLNELAGGRVDLEYTPRFSLGFGLAYANLKGKDGRSHNVLPEAMLGYRLPLGRVVGVPFHFAGGYLPKNGPTLRVGAGVDFRLGDKARLELMLLEPMVWLANDRPESSLNLGLGFSAAL